MWAWFYLKIKSSAQVESLGRALAYKLSQRGMRGKAKQVPLFSRGGKRSKSIPVVQSSSLVHRLLTASLKLVSRSQTLTFFLHAEGKVGSGQLTLSRLFCFPKIIGGVSGSAIST